MAALNKEDWRAIEEHRDLAGRLNSLNAVGKLSAPAETSDVLVVTGQVGVGGVGEGFELAGGCRARKQRRAFPLARAEEVQASRGAGDQAPQGRKAGWRDHERPLREAGRVRPV